MIGNIFRRNHACFVQLNCLFGIHSVGCLIDFLNLLGWFKEFNKIDLNSFNLMLYVARCAKFGEQA